MDRSRPIGSLYETLRRIDGRGYKAYKDVRGRYAADGFLLAIDHVQGDPFADPSRVRVLVPAETSRLPEWTRSTPQRRVTTADFLNRAFADALDEYARPAGSGNSGQLRVLRPGQAVLERSSVIVRSEGEVEARFQVGLPASGRRVLGREAVRLFSEDVTDAVLDSLVMEALDPAALREHVETVESAQALRGQLAERGLVGFVPDGAVLPRASGTSDRPLAEEAVPFRSPPELRVTLETPHHDAVTGMGVPRGVFLIVGGGFHGKSTLLRALERGVYDHVPGDGRELVVTDPGAVKVRAEDGRAVTGTDIANFIDHLPGGTDTRAFSTRNASGSTSQAAALIEALEAGASAILMDEDTSATNLLIRDARMQALIAGELEPITPYIDRARYLADELGISTLLVCGGSGDYFDVADHVLAMEAYEPISLTPYAREIARKIPTCRKTGGVAWRTLRPRVLARRCIDARKGRRDRSIKTPTVDRLVFGSEEVPLAGLEQLIEVAQGRAAAHALAWAAERILDGHRTVPQILDRIMAELDEKGLDAFTPFPRGTLTRFRRFEVAALLGRLRSLRVVRPAVEEPPHAPGARPRGGVVPGPPPDV